MNPEKLSAVSARAGWIAVILLPALITMVMVLTQYTGCMQPGFSDEFSHWHQIKTFSEAGFSGGFYTWNEHVAKLPISHFGNWGPGFAMLFGSLSKLFGVWKPDSAIYYNTMVLTLALGVLVLVTRPEPRQTALLLLLFATFWPVLLYVPRTMQTTLHVSFAILFATLFYAQISLKHRIKTINLCFAVLLAVAVAVQFTWMLIVFPWLLTRANTLNGRQILIRIAAAVGLNSLAAAYFKFMAPPYPYEPGGEAVRAALVGLKPLVDQIAPRFLYIAGLRGDVFERILWIQCALLLAIVAFLSRQWFYAKMRNWAESSPKQLVIALLGVFSAVLLVWGAALDYQLIPYFVIPLAVLLYPVIAGLISKFKNADSKDWHILDSYLLVAGLTVFLAVSITILLGFADEHRGLRFIAPFFLVACLVLILGKHMRAALIIISVAVAGIPSFFNYYKQLGQGSWFSCAAQTNIGQFETQILPHLKYLPAAGPWCNTLLFELEAFQPSLIAVPPGYGLSFIYSLNLEMPLRSKYVLVGGTVRKLLEERGARLKFLTGTNLGGLYLNKEARCPP